MLTQSQFSRSITNFPSKSAKVHQSSPSFFGSKLDQFSTKTRNSFWFVLQSSFSPTVLRKLCKKTSNSWLFTSCSTMEFGDFSHLDRAWAEIQVAFIFLSLLLRLFWRITRGNSKNINCSIQGTWTRISPFLEFPYAFWRSCNVDHYDRCSFWND